MLFQLGKWKREIARGIWRTNCLEFEDAIELSRNDWVGIDMRSGRLSKVPHTLLNYAGFECDSLSAANSKRKLQGESCILEGTGKTSTTADLKKMDFRKILIWAPLA